MDFALKKCIWGFASFITILATKTTAVRIGAEKKTAKNMPRAQIICARGFFTFYI